MSMTERIAVLGENGFVDEAETPEEQREGAACPIGSPDNIDGAQPLGGLKQELHEPDAAGQGSPPVTKRAPGKKAGKSGSKVTPSDPEPAAEKEPGDPAGEDPAAAAEDAPRQGRDRNVLHNVWPEVYSSRQNRSILKWPVVAVEEHQIRTKEGPEKVLCLAVGKDRVKGIIPFPEAGVKPGQSKAINRAKLAKYIGQEVAFIVSVNRLDQVLGVWPSAYACGSGRRFFAMDEALKCSTQDRNNLAGAARADQWLQRILDAQNESALIEELEGVTLTGRMRDWLNAALTHNRLFAAHPITDPNDRFTPLNKSVLECIQRRLILAAEAVLEKQRDVNRLHVLFLLFGRSVRLSDSIRQNNARELLRKGYNRLAPDNAVARRDLAICLGELGDDTALKTYLTDSETDVKDRNRNLDWLARLVEEDFPGPRVLYAMVDILERGLQDQHVSPLVELNLRTLDQLLDRSRDMLYQEVSLRTMHDLHRLVRVIHQANGSPGVAKRATSLIRRLVEMTTCLEGEFRSLTELYSGQRLMSRALGEEMVSSTQHGF